MDFSMNHGNEAMPYDIHELFNSSNGTFTADSALFKQLMKNISNGEFDALEEPVWRGIIITLYVIVITMGVTFNGVVIYILGRNRTMWNVTNVFIGNLALSDIFLCLFNLPVQLYYQLSDNWIFGDILCQIIMPLFALPVHVSAMTMLLIAMDRYWLIVFPLRNRMSLRTAVILIIITSTISVSVAIPLMVFSRTHQVSHPDLAIYKNFCMEEWPSNTGRIVYTSLVFSIQFCLPLLATSIMYQRIYVQLLCRPVQHSDNRRKHRTNKILMSIVIVFCCCWLPWNIFTLVNELFQGLLTGRFIKFTDLILKIFAVSSACVNPFLYGWFNDNFRKEMNSFLVKMRKDGSLRIKRQGYRDEMTEDLNDGRSACDPLNNYSITIDRITTTENI
ncbi:prolactin-releasing peptide receptor-like [Tubulanus polymorphus]|uniref:prolactin-releasing peptide receptor-like n=1 Tax=Tubulanus polymorphus TaxID=672921 RepID=UPI003DA66E3D